MIEIRDILLKNITYEKNNIGYYILDDYIISQKIAWELGFSDYVASIIRSVFLRLSPSGELEKDVIKYSEEIKKSIWRT